MNPNEIISRTEASIISILCSLKEQVQSIEQLPASEARTAAAQNVLKTAHGFMSSLGTLEEGLDEELRRHAETALAPAASSTIRLEYAHQQNPSDPEAQERYRKTHAAFIDATQKIAQQEADLLRMTDMFFSRVRTGLHRMIESIEKLQ